ncbi:complex I subunit 5 family protein [Roseomonas populi]|uniref:NADH-quinone oxidoreductase subunit E n=1 Tax=Roseomonas populi TaxID=3121582 RepID=A0ABT1WZG9_9PROT|nr:proton-conducting transporter membrane subunit [Roseomonas pecuniae]MCR0981238.1 NADH-quinone oxidoreductase subunit E [Roseomonas pecuniae]
MSSALPPLAAAGPILVAAILLALGHHLPRRSADIVAVLTALAVVGLGVLMATRTGNGALLHWFGGWSPRDGLPIGIAFQADLAGSAMVALVGLLFAASFVFAWGFFEEVGVQFHVLMLVFMAAMCGFCLTRDLFNLFVWFEVMSVAAFALTAYRLEASALEGALNFTVTNSLGSLMMLAGIGLLYARLGRLDMLALGEEAARAAGDPVIPGAFCLLAAALLIKGATVPFHLWLADAHAVAPSPVSMVFSGAMVAMGVFGLARLTWTIFAPVAEVTAALHAVILWLGAAAAVLGGMLCLGQRHVKRMLAFSTVSHTGILLMGVALLSAEGLAGTLAYLVGHGLVKGALFALAGVLMARLGGIDEIGLRGRGREIWPAGLAFAAGGLLLAGLPVGLMEEGTKLLDAAAGSEPYPWVILAVPIGAGLTGAAVLRATGRIFLGWGEVKGEEEHAPSEDEAEKANRPLPLMLAPVVAMLLLAALLPAHLAAEVAQHAATGMMQPGITPASVSGGEVPQHLPLGLLGLGLALLIAGWHLGRSRLPTLLSEGVEAVSAPVFAGLERLHSGLIGDELAWILAGLALLSLGIWFA